MSKFKGEQYYQSGFTLIEILVALFLLTVIFIAIPTSNPDDSRQKMEQALDDMERIVRFADNETILRNSIVRLHIQLDQDGQMTYSLQAGPQGSFVLPKLETDLSKLNLKERQELEKKQLDIGGQFSDIPEFKDSNRGIPEGIKFIGMGCHGFQALKVEAPFDLYFYPNGDRDNCLLIFASRYEIATIEIPSIGMDFMVDYSSNPPFDLVDELEDYIFKTSAKLFQDWRN
jgi:prepilin-type N-terminal cleavage/methylation domain-containing protein